MFFLFVLCVSVCLYICYGVAVCLIVLNFIYYRKKITCEDDNNNNSSNNSRNNSNSRMSIVLPAPRITGELLNGRNTLEKAAWITCQCHQLQHRLLSLFNRSSWNQYKIVSINRYDFIKRCWKWRKNVQITVEYDICS